MKVEPLIIPFLGREIFDCNNMTYKFKDGSGEVPYEMKLDLDLAFVRYNAMGCNGLSVLSTLWDRKDKLVKIKGE
jgi:hypothetical protein